MSALFWICATLIVIAQVMILRSTRRAFRVAEGAGRTQSAVLEWTFAIGPAVAIAFLLFFSWRAATQPPVMEVQFDGTTISALP